MGVTFGEGRDCRGYILVVVSRGEGFCDGQKFTNQSSAALQTAAQNAQNAQASKEKWSLLRGRETASGIWSGSKAFGAGLGLAARHYCGIYGESGA